MPHRFLPVIASILIALTLAIGCERNGTLDPASSVTPLGPSPVTPGGPAANAGAAVGATAASRGLPNRNVTMMDACDPDTFNAPPPAGVGPGTCVRSGGVTFAMFLEQLGKHGSIGAWHFAPPNTSAKLGQTFLAVNRGGEVHTFTEVDQFGGGIVAPLNALTGNTVIAPECTALEEDDFVAPGATYTEEPLDHTGTVRFQCCIHPWMRLEVNVSEK
jgi:plastocyanin